MKEIFQLLIITYVGLSTQTSTWPAEQKVQYATLMLDHNILNSDEDRKIEQLIKEQKKPLLSKSNENINWVGYGYQLSKQKINQDGR